MVLTNSIERNKENEVHEVVFVADVSELHDGARCDALDGLASDLDD